MSKFLMVVLSVALLGLGSAGVAYRGWQETHPGDPSPDLTKHSASEILASTYVWITGGSGKDIPVVARQIAEQTPALPKVDLSKFDLTRTVNDVVAWVSGGGSVAPAAPVAAKPAAPAPAPAPAPVAVAAAPAPAPVVKAPAAAPLAPPTPAPAPVPMVAKAKEAPVAPVAPTRQADDVAGPEVLSLGGNWTVPQKGCAIGGVTGLGAALVVGPAEVAALTTGAAAALPATARLVGTVIAGALVTGCAVGAVVAPLLDH
ncbi:MAG: hypothetical protein WCO00_09525 [Rhodospirillaceae bacterium]